MSEGGSSGEKARQSASSSSGVRKLKSLKTNDRKRSAPRTRSHITPTKKSKVNYPEGSLKSKLQKSGLYDAPDSWYEHKLIKGFEEYWSLDKLKCGDVLANNLRNLTRILYATSDDKVVPSTTSLTIDSLRNFFNVTLGDVQYQTKSNYNKSLVHFFKYLKQSESRLNNKVEWERLELVYEWVQTRAGTYEAESRREHSAKRTVTGTIVPPHPHELVKVVDLSFPRAKHLLEQAKERELGKYEVATVNRYFSALLCMTCGQRPGVARHLRVGEFMNGQFKREWYIFHGHHHKTTSSAGPAKLFISRENYELFQTYIRHVRSQIDPNNKSDSLLLCWGGQSFRKVGDGIKKLQIDLDLPVITANMARSSYETHNLHLPKDVQKMMADNLAHSERVRDSHYRAFDYKGIADWADIMTNLQNENMHDTNEEIDLNQAFHPVLIPSNPLELTDTKQESIPVLSPALSPVVSLEKLDIESTSLGGKAKQLFSKVKASLAPRFVKHEPSESPNKSVPETPKKRMLQIAETWVQANAPFTHATKLPHAKDIQREYGVKLITGQKVVDQLRYQKTMIIHRDVARKIITAECRRRGISVRELPIPPPAPEYATQMRYSGQVNINDKRIERAIKSVFATMQAEDFSQTDEEVLQLISSQKWPNLTQCSAIDQGKFVVSGKSFFYKGQVVCDYHGTHIPRREGDSLLANYRPSDEGANYMMFYHNPSGKKMCVNANMTPCKCHPDIPTTMGRLINHSTNHANLKNVVKTIQGSTHVLFVAKHDILPLTQLLFDYGVRKYEDGTAIPWAKS